MNRVNIRKINELNVLREIFNKAPTSRAAVTSDLGLTKSTVYSIFSVLSEAGLIYDIGQGSSTRNGGRKPALTNFNSNFGYTINTKINRNSVSCMLNWLDGSIISYQEFPVIGETASQHLLALYQAVRSSILADEKLLGISVGIYGVVHENRIVKATIQDLKDFNLEEVLHSRFEVPVVVENEANLSALRIRDFSSEESVQNAIVVSLLDGIGAGIIIAGELYTGVHSEAGEVGHTPFYGLSDPVSIEDLCSDLAVMSRIADLKGHDIGMADIRKGFDADDADIKLVLQQFCTGIEMILQNLILSFDPEKIVINSQILRAIPELLTIISAKLRPFAHKSTPIILSDSPERAALLGGCALISRDVLGLPMGKLVFKNRNVPQ